MAIYDLLVRQQSAQVLRSVLFGAVCMNVGGQVANLRLIIYIRSHLLVVTSPRTVLSHWPIYCIDISLSVSSCPYLSVSNRSVLAPFMPIYGDP